MDEEPGRLVMRHTWVVTVLWSLAALAWTSSASAASRKPSLFSMFEAVCLSHRGDTEGARAAAGALGFAPSMVEPGAGRVDWLERKSENIRYVAMISERTLPNGEDGSLTRLSECSVAAFRPDAAVPSLVRAWAGFSPQTDNGVFASYYYREVGGVRTPLASDQIHTPLKEVLREGPLALLTVLHPKRRSKGATVVSISSMALLPRQPQAAAAS